MAETLDETRKRFRKEFPDEADVLEYLLPHAWRIDGLKKMWEMFAVGAGHPHDAKFKENKED